MRTIEEIFHDRTCYKFQDKPIDVSLLREIYDLMKLGPTSSNSCPLRILFVQSMEEKEKLYQCLAPANVEKTRSAPVSAIFAYDLRFYEKMDRLFAHNIKMKEIFASSEAAALDTATRNSTLQAAYFMMIARSKGLDCGGMSGFNPEAVNKTFFADTGYRANFICNLGHKDGEASYPKLPRLDFEEVCKII